MKTTPERTVEEIVEEFKEISQTFIKAGWDETNNLAYKQFETNWTNEQLDWLTQTLQAERQKCVEMLVELCDIFSGDKDRDIVNVGAILGVAQKYGITLTNPNNPK